MTVDATDQGFIIPLPYGADTDWCQNVRKAGVATLEYEGESFTLVEPQLIDAESAHPLLSAKRWQALRRFHVTHFLVVRTIAEMPTVKSAPVAAAVST